MGLVYPDLPTRVMAASMPPPDVRKATDPRYSVPPASASSPPRPSTSSSSSNPKQVRRHGTAAVHVRYPRLFDKLQNERIDAERRESRRRLYENWKSIIDKYGAIRPEDDDVLDLRNEIVVCDRGAIRKLTGRDLGEAMDGRNDEPDDECIEEDPRVLGPENVHFGEDEDELGDWDERSGLDPQYPDEPPPEPEKDEADISDLEDFMAANARMQVVTDESDVDIHTWETDDDASAGESEEEEQPEVGMSLLDLGFEDVDAPEPRRVVPAPTRAHGQALRRVSSSLQASSSRHAPRLSSTPPPTSTADYSPTLRDLFTPPLDIPSYPSRDLDSRQRGPRRSVAFDRNISVIESSPPPSSPSNGKGKERMRGERPYEEILPPAGVLKRSSSSRVEERSASRNERYSSIITSETGIVFKTLAPRSPPRSSSARPKSKPPVASGPEPRCASPEPRSAEPSGLTSPLIRLAACSSPPPELSSLSRLVASSPPPPEFPLAATRPLATSPPPVAETSHARGRAQTVAASSTRGCVACLKAQKEPGAKKFPGYRGPGHCPHVLPSFASTQASSLTTLPQDRRATPPSRSAVNRSQSVGSSQRRPYGPRRCRQCREAGGTRAKYALWCLGRNRPRFCNPEEAMRVARSQPSSVAPAKAASRAPSQRRRTAALSEEESEVTETEESEEWEDVNDTEDDDEESEEEADNDSERSPSPTPPRKTAPPDPGRSLPVKVRASAPGSDAASGNLWASVPRRPVPPSSSAMSVVSDDSGDDEPTASLSRRPAVPSDKSSGPRTSVSMDVACFLRQAKTAQLMQPTPPPSVSSRADSLCSSPPLARLATTSTGPISKLAAPRGRTKPHEPPEIRRARTSLPSPSSSIPPSDVTVSTSSPPPSSPPLSPRRFRMVERSSPMVAKTVPTLADSLANRSFTLSAPPRRSAVAPRLTEAQLMPPPPVPQRRRPSLPSSSYASASSSPPSRSLVQTTPRKRVARTYADDSSDDDAYDDGEESDTPAVRPLKFTTASPAPARPASTTPRHRDSSRSKQSAPPSSTPRKRQRGESTNLRQPLPRGLDSPFVVDRPPLALSDDSPLVIEVEDDGEWGMDEDVGPDARQWREASTVRYLSDDWRNTMNSVL